MPKSRTRKKTRKGRTKQIDWGGAAAKGSGRINLVLGAIAAVALVAGGLYLWRTYRASGDFEALAAQGQPALARVETTPDFGGGHLAPGQGHLYDRPFPTSGIHDRTPVAPGFYDERQPATKLVHSVEHGHIVIYYELPGETAIQRLKDWTSLYGGHWDGVVATPSSGLGKAALWTAWRTILRLDEFDAAAAAAFIDKFRGRGPENPVR